MTSGKNLTLFLFSILSFSNLYAHSPFSGVGLYFGRRSNEYHGSLTLNIQRGDFFIYMHVLPVSVIPKDEYNGSKNKVSLTVPAALGAIFGGIVLSEVLKTGCLVVSSDSNLAKKTSNHTTVILYAIAAANSELHYYFVETEPESRGLPVFRSSVFISTQSDIYAGDKTGWIRFTPTVGVSFSLSFLYFQAGLSKSYDFTGTSSKNHAAEFSAAAKFIIGL